MLGILASVASLVLGAVTAHHADAAHPAPARALPAHEVPRHAPTVHTSTGPYPEPVEEVARELPSQPDPTRFEDGRVITGATAHRLILFSFDDGPDLNTTPRLLDELDAAGVHAVFFTVASRIEGDTPRQREQADLLGEIERRGHLIGHHTVHHRQLPLLSNEEIIAEVDDGQRDIERVLGHRPYLLRPPGGARSPRVDRLLAARGYTEMLWNLGTGDFQVRDADEVVRTFRRVLQRRERENGERGGIVLMHDPHPWTVEAFPRIVAELRAKNCELLAQGEELYDIVDDPRFFFEARRGDDGTALAQPAEPEASVLRARQERLRSVTSARCSQVARR